VPIKWSALQVSEAAGMIEEFLSKAAEPLEQARLVAQEARKITNLPQYVDSDFVRILGKIDDCLGGPNHPTGGWFKSTVKSIRDDLPSGAIEKDKEKRRLGEQQALV
jgi:hypothetical protein